jgi:hypothetical protein
VLEQLLPESEALLEPVRATVVAGALPVVQADPDDMYSVLANLVLNAVKFARPGVPPLVNITSQRTGNGWRLSVSDNGVGIPENRRVDIFSRFTRVQTGVSGHGIGLRPEAWRSGSSSPRTRTPHSNRQAATDRQQTPVGLGGPRGSVLGSVASRGHARSISRRGWC